MKSCMEVMTFKMTSIPYYSMPQLQPFQNGGRLNFWGGCNFWTDWWIWMKFCMEVMALNIVYCKLMWKSRHISSSQNFLFLLFIISQLLTFFQICGWRGQVPDLHCLTQAPIKLSAYKNNVQMLPLNSTVKYLHVYRWKSRFRRRQTYCIRSEVPAPHHSETVQ
jgi:hypothetical protein